MLEQIIFSLLKPKNSEKSEVEFLHLVHWVDHYHLRENDLIHDSVPLFGKKIANYSNSNELRHFGAFLYIKS